MRNRIRTALLIVGLTWTAVFIAQEVVVRDRGGDVATVTSGKLDVNSTSTGTSGAELASETTLDTAVTALEAIQAAVEDTTPVAVAGDVAHDSADSGNPLKIGAKALALSSNPTGVTANDRANLITTRASQLFTIGGHPNTVTLSAQIQDADGAQTDAAIVTVSSGTKIVVTRLTASCDGSTTAPTNIKVGFATATLASSAHTGVATILHEFDGVPAGGGFTIGDGGGIIGIGADDADLRITTEDPAGGNCSVSVSYFTIEG